MDVIIPPNLCVVVSFCKSSNFKPQIVSWQLIQATKYPKERTSKCKLIHPVMPWSFIKLETCHPGGPWCQVCSSHKIMTAPKCCWTFAEDPIVENEIKALQWLGRTFCPNCGRIICDIFGYFCQTIYNMWLSPNGSNIACRFQHLRGSPQGGHKPGSRNEDVALQFGKWPSDAKGSWDAQSVLQGNISVPSTVIVK